MDNEYKNAKYYDAFLYLFVRRIRYKILEIVKQNGYKKILDVCCGTANQLKLLKKHGIEGIGIDLSEPMLSIAKLGKYKVDCYEQDAENTHFDNNSFDMTTTTFALHEKSNQSAKKILNEMIRLTKIEGHLIIVDFSITEKTSTIAKKGISFIESLAGGDHFNNYQNFVFTKGLDNLLKDLPLKLLEEHSYALNGVLIKVLQKTD